MKKRKILYLFPLAALVLSGCTIQEGWETAKGFMTDKVYEPVKNWIESLLGKKSGKQDQPADEPSGGGEQGGGGGGGQTETPKHAGTLADPFDAADALLVAGKLADKATSASAYYIKDKVTDTPQFSASYGNFTFNFGEFKCYRILNGESKAKFTDEKAIEQGDTVLLNAKLMNYNGTLETAENTGYAVSITKADHGNIKRIVSAKGPKEVGLNEVIALTEVEVIIEYDDGFMTTVNPSSLDQDTSVPGAVTITVHVEGFSGTATFTVTVLDGQLPNQIEEAYAAASELENYKETDQEYLIRGTVVAKRGSQDYFVQEGEYGIDLYNPGEVEGLEIGKEVQFKSRIKNYNGTFENATTPTVKVLGEGTMPSELVISTADEFAAANKNILARASGTAKDAPVVDNYGGYTLTLVSNQDELTVYAKSGQASKITSIKKDDEVILSKLVTGAYKTDLQLLVCDNTIVSPMVTAVNVQESMNIELGQQKALTATVSPEEACQDVTWEISQTSEVINYVDGVVIPVSEGDAVITFASVIAPEITASCEVHVSEATKILTGITLGGELEKDTYNEGEEYSAAGLTVTAHYENAPDDDVTADSVITPEKAQAEANDESITFTASYSGQEDTLVCSVTVIAKPTPQHEGTEQDPYTVNDAKILYDELETGQNTTEVYVTGTIAADPEPTVVSNRARFYLTDGVCPTNLYVYNIDPLADHQGEFTAHDVPPGSVIVAKGAIKKFASGNDLIFEFCYVKNVAACQLISVDKPAVAPETVSIVSDAEVMVDEDLTLKADVRPLGSPQDVTWELIDGSEYATLTNGVLHGVAVGKVHVQATVLNTQIKSEIQEITVKPAAQPEHAGTLADPYTPSDVLLAFKNLVNDEISETGVYVAGEIAADPAPYLSSGKGRIYLTDGTKSIYVYNVYDGNNSASLTQAEIAAGLNVVVSGAVTRYQDNLQICYKSGKGNCQIVSSDIAPTSVQITSADEVFAGETLTLASKVLPSTATQAVTYSITSGSEYASINGNVLTAGDHAGQTVTVQATVTGHETVITTQEITIKDSSTATREALPYTGNVSGGALPAGWEGDGATFATSYYALKGAGKHAYATKLIDPVSSLTVAVTGICNGTTTDSEVTVYGLNDAGERIEGASATYVPDKASASNASAVESSATEKTVTISGTDITGVEIELTVKGHNYVLTCIKLS